MYLPRLYMKFYQPSFLLH